jgi:CheY-like chemotaxis protein
MDLNTSTNNQFTFKNQFLSVGSVEELFCAIPDGADFDIYENDPQQFTRLFTIPPKILLVEDSTVVQKIITQFLKILGCVVDIAADGHQAIAMYKNGYDLILLDIGLPGISGLGVSIAIRSQETLKRIPIVAITISADSVRADCLSVGIDEVMQKPISLEQIKQILLRWLVSK